MKYAFENYKDSADFLISKKFINADIGIILGSGLGSLVSKLENTIRVPYTEIPFFVKPTMTNHEGALYHGSLSNKNVIVMSGRYHYYEGYDFTDITYPIRVMKILGVKKLIVTNAAGAINTDFQPGELMLITDHIKFFHESPARGKNIEEFGPRFFDKTDTYSKVWRASVKAEAQKIGIDLREGVYAYMPGPQFETPTEIKGLRILGADAVGMSTVPEVIVAVHCGIKTLGISCISNMAAGITDQPITDAEVIEVTSKISNKFIKLIELIVNNSA